MNNRFIKTLVIINGILFPIFVVYFLYKSITDSWTRDNYQSESIIVGEELEDAKRDSLALQGLTYESPIDVYNSTNYYLPISVMTYEEAKLYKEAVASAGDISPDAYGNNYFNVIFFDMHYNVIGQLLDKKASITEIFINHGHDVYRYDYQEKEVDKTVRNIAYSIGFEDSNKDGKLNSLDNHDLYVSDLDGKNLKQVTKEIDVLDYQFINSNSEIFIRFKDRSNIRDEYKYVKFGLYNVESGIFKELKDMESKLLEIEKKLVR
ncbi:MAG: hypothetical protein HOP30_21865 [Cyclobacteriaceae bacterium]|nr:hypothetical protein [Cyclobacteriaceae bacterium]